MKYPYNHLKILGVAKMKAYIPDQFDDEDYQEERPTSDFYFAMEAANGSNYPMCDEPVLYVILKESWDNERFWNDEYADMTDQMVEPLGYGRLTECCYEITDHDMDECRRKMVALGFTENPDILKGPFGTAP